MKKTVASPMLSCNNNSIVDGDIEVYMIKPNEASMSGGQVVQFHGKNFKEGVGYRFYFGMKKSHSLIGFTPNFSLIIFYLKGDGEKEKSFSNLRRKDWASEPIIIPLQDHGMGITCPNDSIRTSFL